MALPSPPVVIPVILCGGEGSRLWPVSRQSYPKQFGDLLDGPSLFQRTAVRLRGAVFGPPWILTGEQFRFTVTEQLEAIGISAAGILLEPEPKNTGPAICALALAIQQEDPHAILLISPSDHLIPDDEGFREAVSASVADAQAGRIVLFGIEPTHAETGYGWITTVGGSQGDASPLKAVAKFVEKPDLARAQELLAEKGNYWNAGIFLFRADVILRAFEEFHPQIVEKVRLSLAGSSKDLGFTRMASTGWSDVESISVDYAIMENASDLYVKPFAGGWSDLGDWSSVRTVGVTDDMGNTPATNATYIDCRNVMLKSTSPDIELVGINLQDLVVVATPDAVLVADSSKAQDVRLGVDMLKQKSASQAVQARRDFRPWGWFEVVDKGPRFQVKRLVIKPGGTLSLQTHEHRSEHWIVVRGVASVTLGESEREVKENESVFIPVGVKHRLANRTEAELMLVEVQTGSYLGEDDIKRFEDVYKRDV